MYARFGVAHEFMGDGRFTAVNAAGTAADPIEVDGKDTWVEYAVGANFNITKQTYEWADLECVCPAPKSTRTGAPPSAFATPSDVRLTPQA